jgi:cytochrome b6-f complex iron-sulfur subunit
MADGDQERFEDYLELEKYIEALQAGKAAHPPLNLTPEQIRIYQVAALFRSANEQEVQPRPEFVEQLRSQMNDGDEQQKFAPAIRTSTETRSSTESAPSKKPEVAVRAGAGSARRARFFSRRGLLTGGAVAAASLVVGAGVEHIRYGTQESAARQEAEEKKDPGYAASQNLGITQNIPTTWHLVTSLADLGSEAVRFTSESVIGYVVRVVADYHDKDGKGQESIIALSAACTHMGCLIQWRGTERHFYCPCHGAIFGAQGEPPQANYKYSIPPLPRLNTKIENGNVYVELPKLH